jgi:hypothetical protein
LEPPVLRASEHSKSELKVYRANMLGWKVPFSVVDVRFQIEEGAGLVTLDNESSEGNVTVKSKGIEGEAIVGIYSVKSGMQIQRVLIKILPRDVAVL